MRLFVFGIMAATLAASIPAQADTHHEWKLDRPTVSHFWPAKGDAGAKVTIRGENFAPDSVVVLGTVAVPGAHVTPNEISFTVPHDAKSGEVAIRGGGRQLIVGSYEVAHYDAVHEAAKLDDDRRQKAEGAWKSRQATLAKDATARAADLTKREHDLEATREQRRTVEASDLQGKWDRRVLGDPEVQAELTLHGQRVAELDRMDRLATAKADGKLVVRIQVAIAKENDRHAQRMSTLKAAIK